MNVLQQTTDLQCSPSGDCIWNNRNRGYSDRHIAQKRIQHDFVTCTFCTKRGRSAIHCNCQKSPTSSRV